jgi:hypothetical protein
MSTPDKIEVYSFFVWQRRDSLDEWSLAINGVNLDEPETMGEVIAVVKSMSVNWPQSELMIEYFDQLGGIITTSDLAPL